MQTDPSEMGVPEHADKPVNPQALAREWADLLDTLVPPDRTVVEDITGQEHNLRANLPAAVEMRVLRVLQDIRLPDDSNLGEKIRAARGQTSEVLGGVVNSVIRMASDEGVLSTLGEAFALAHPGAVRRAREAASVSEDLEDYAPDGEWRVIDLFSTADIVAGIVPFGLRAVSRIGGTVTSLLPSKN